MTQAKTYALRTIPSELTDLAHIYLEAVNTKASSPRTASNYADTLEPFVQFLHEQGVTRLQDVTPLHITRFLALKKQTGITGVTLAKHYTILKAFWNWLVRMELTEQNLLNKIPRPRAEQKVKPALTVEQIGRILQACEGKGWLRLRDYALICTLLDTGARAMEVWNLTCAQVFRDPLILYGKGAKERFAFLSPETKIAIRRYLKACPFRPEGEQPLWWGERGALTLQGLLEVVEDIGERAGIRPLGCHIFRRTYAVLSLRNGIDLHRLQALLGHADLRTTQAYLPLTEQDLREAHERFSPLRTLSKERR